MGHLLTAQGLKPDPNKVEATLKLKTPGIKEEIERLNSTVNYLAKFLQDFPKSWSHLGD